MAGASDLVDDRAGEAEEKAPAGAAADEEDDGLPSDEEEASEGSDDEGDSDSDDSSAEGEDEVRTGAHKRPIAPLSMISGRQSAGRGPRQPCVGPAAAHHRARQRLRLSISSVLPCLPQEDAFEKDDFIVDEADDDGKHQRAWAVGQTDSVP